MNICILENLIAVCLISLYNITVIGEAKFVNVVVALFSVQSMLKVRNLYASTLDSGRQLFVHFLENYIH